MKRNAHLLDGFTPFLRKELRESWRSGRLPVVALVFFAFGLISPLTAKYLPDILQGAAGSVKIIFPAPQASDAVDQFLKNVAGATAGMIVGGRALTAAVPGAFQAAPPTRRRVSIGGRGVTHLVHWNRDEHRRNQEQRPYEELLEVAQSMLILRSRFVVRREAFARRTRFVAGAGATRFS